MADRISEVPARVIYAPDRESIQILLAPGQGLADGGIPITISIDLVPFDLRMPNTKLLVAMRNGTIINVQRAADLIPGN
jgi:hypothetical protein